MPKIERILVPVDLSPSSKAAIEYAVFLAQKFGATLDLLHVASPDKVRGGDDVSNVFRGVPGSTMEAYHEQDVQRQLNDFVKSAGLNRAVRNDEIEESKDPAQLIVKTAADKGYDLIVIGATGKGKGLVERMMGSVAQKIVQNAPCPVITCRGA